MSYEEGASIDIKILFNSEKIKIEKEESVSSVYGDYENSERLEFTDTHSFITWLKTEIQL